MIIVRAETPTDILAVRLVNERAFGRPGEADMVDALRQSARPCISLVAISGEQVAGHIFFSPVSINSDDATYAALALGPMAVLPEQQGRGIGSRLVRRGLEECRLLGHEAVFVLGHPEYYPRFGFAPARAKGITCVYAVPDEAFMVTELRAGALDGRTGVVKYHAEFDKV